MTTDEAPPEMNPTSPLAALLAVQDEDVRRDQLLHRRERLEERQHLAAVTKRLGALDVEVSSLASERERTSARQEEIDGSVTDLERRVAALDRRLSGGEVASFRDQEAMAGEMASLAEQQRHREDAELEVMEALETLDARLTTLAADRRQLVDEELAAKSALEQAEAAMAAELAEVDTRRRALTVDVPSAVLGEYERLRGRLAGVGAARIVNGACSGCHLHLSAIELDQLRRLGPGEFAHCEQCGRILVP